MVLGWLCWLVDLVFLSGWASLWEFIFFDVLVRSRFFALVGCFLWVFVLCLIAWEFCLLSVFRSGLCLSSFGLCFECFVVVSQSLVEVSSWEFALAGVTCDYF